MSLFYKFQYLVGLKPWKQMPTLPIGEQAVTLLDREEIGLQRPYGRSLDLGCGSGIWSVRLAQRGWDVTGIDVVPGFRLFLDFGTVHGLADDAVRAVGREVSEVAAEDATLLMYAFSPGHRGPLPRGIDHDEIERAYTGWSITHEEVFDVRGAPAFVRKARPRSYCLRRRYP